MNDELTEENFWAILGSMAPPKTIYYRLYYNDQGRPLLYSHEEQPGNYIDITPEQFALGDLRVRVVNKVIVSYQPPISKLVPGDTGIACDPRDVTIVVSTEQAHTKWKFETHERIL